MERLKPDPCIHSQVKRESSCWFGTKRPEGSILAVFTASHRSEWFSSGSSRRRRSRYKIPGPVVSRGPGSGHPGAGEGRTDGHVWACAPAHCQVRVGCPPHSPVARTRSTAKRPRKVQQSQFRLFAGSLGSSPTPLGSGEEWERLDIGMLWGQGGRAGFMPLPFVCSVPCASASPPHG